MWFVPSQTSWNDLFLHLWLHEFLYGFLEIRGGSTHPLAQLTHSPLLTYFAHCTCSPPRQADEGSLSPLSPNVHRQFMLPLRRPSKWLIERFELESNLSPLHSEYPLVICVVFCLGWIGINLPSFSSVSALYYNAVISSSYSSHGIQGSPCLEEQVK